MGTFALSLDSSVYFDNEIDLVMFYVHTKPSTVKDFCRHQFSPFDKINQNCTCANEFEFYNAYRNMCTYIFLWWAKMCDIQSYIISLPWALG